MIKRVKIYGAGSIGNHLANASRSLGYDVVICDIDEDALKRTKNDIYPKRYGAWDEDIKLYRVGKEPVGGFDLIIIVTPPDTHLKIALDVLKEVPKAILVEKPLCGPDLNNAKYFYEECINKGVRAFVGYDHLVGESTNKAREIMSANIDQKIETLDVEFREYWGGIFDAHHWLKGPSESYLGYSSKGGGATGEHSHAINLWQNFSHHLGQGKIISVNSQIKRINDGSVDYDSISCMNFKTETGFIGRCVQDVVTFPPKKYARIQFSKGYLEWHCNSEPGKDKILYNCNNELESSLSFSKTRPEDFILELKHIDRVLDNDSIISPINIKNGFETMLVIAAVYKSGYLKKTINIDYDKGFNLEALT